MQCSIIFFIICYFCSFYNFFELNIFCFAQYDRIGNTYEQIRDADFYKKPGHKYPERIGSYGEEQNRGKGSFSKQSTDGHDPRNEKKLSNNNNNSNNDQNLSGINKKD